MTQQRQSWECAEVRLSLGVYVLGAIDPAERAQVDAHLATCRDCRDELAGLASLPALLARVGTEELARIESGADEPAAEVAAPPELVNTVLDLGAARRRKARWRYAAVAAAIVGLVGGVLGGVAAIRSSGPVSPPSALCMWGCASGAHVETAHGVNHQTGASADISYADENWGLGLYVTVHGIQVDTKCDLFAVFKDGRTQWLANWMTWWDEGKVGYTASLAANSSEIASFQIKAGQKVLVTVVPT